MSKSSGYPVSQFLTPPPSSVLCAKCKQVLVNPYHLSCCKSFLCEDCLLSIQQSNDTKCPSCESNDYEYQSSNTMKEQVNILLLKCSNNAKGCKWQGQLGELDIHLFISCPYAIISCERGCSDQFVRCESNNHHCVLGQRHVPPSIDRSLSSVEQLTHRISEIQRKQDEEISVVKNEIRKFNSVKLVGSRDESSNYVKLSFDVRALKHQLAESVQRELITERKLKQQAEEIRILKETHNMFRLQFDNLIGE